MSAPELNAAGLVRALDDPLRYAVLSLLVAGPATVSELMARTGSAQSKLSNHLALLHEHGLVTRERMGRNVAYALAGSHVASVIEAIEAATGESLALAPAVPEMALARRCYDHLAGRLGVAVYDALVERRAIKPVNAAPSAPKVRDGLGNVTLGSCAHDVFGSFDIDLETLAETRRRFATACNDWTESRPHLAGALGAALQDALFRAGWLQRRSGTRALRITARGRDALPKVFGSSVASVLRS